MIGRQQPAILSRLAKCHLLRDCADRGSAPLVLLDRAVIPPEPGP
ncbi:hypothetical protein ACFFX0_31200 [Citricoccus parietis]|uniref:Uncharacterized protein n=1 Tax=Citricoccus parietis TaxID=592307 RepID=A0ABV5G8V4_9MICC